MHRMRQVALMVITTWWFTQTPGPLALGNEPRVRTWIGPFLTRPACEQEYRIRGLRTHGFVKLSRCVATTAP